MWLGPRLSVRLWDWEVKKIQCLLYVAGTTFKCIHLGKVSAYERSPEVGLYSLIYCFLVSIFLVENRDIPQVFLFYSCIYEP